MENNIKIATWNLCLGLQHKKDYVKSLLEEYNIAILNLQETEIPPGLNSKILEIPNYTLETEKSLSKRRVATYINKNIRYRRRFDLENEGEHMLVIDILGPPQTRIINLYRPFNPKQMPEMTFFCNQITKLDELITTSTIILGDFNLDLNKEYSGNYPKKAYLTMMKNVLGHHGLAQLVTEDTWSRTVNGIKLSSRIDHMYTTMKNRITKQFTRKLCFEVCG